MPHRLPKQEIQGEVVGSLDHQNKAEFQVSDFVAQDLEVMETSRALLATIIGNDGAHTNTADSMHTNLFGHTLAVQSALCVPPAEVSGSGVVSASPVLACAVDVISHVRDAPNFVRNRIYLRALHARRVSRASYKHIGVRSWQYSSE